MIDGKEAFKLALYHFLHEAGEAKKITLHKALFYVREKTGAIPYTFAYEKYGPFSFGLKNDVDDLQEEDQVVDFEYEYRKDHRFHIDLTDMEKMQLLRHIKGFRRLVGDCFDFDTLELYGSVLYAVRVRQEFGEDYGPEGVLDELHPVRAGKRFGQEAIVSAWRDIARDFGIAETAEKTAN